MEKIYISSTEIPEEDYYLYTMPRRQNGKSMDELNIILEKYLVQNCTKKSSSKRVKLWYMDNNIKFEDLEMQPNLKELLGNKVFADINSIQDKEDIHSKYNNNFSIQNENIIGEDKHFKNDEQNVFGTETLDLLKIIIKKDTEKYEEYNSCLLEYSKSYESTKNIIQSMEDNIKEISNDINSFFLIRLIRYTRCKLEIFINSILKVINVNKKL